MASFTSGEMPSRMPVTSATVIAPDSPGSTLRMRSASARRTPSIAAAIRMSQGTGTAAGFSTGRPSTNPVAPSPW